MGSVGAKQTSNNGTAPESNFISLQRDRVDEYTADFTPDMFVDTKNFALIDNQRSLEDGDVAPETLNIGGIEFRKMGNPNYHFESNRSGSNGRWAVLNDYQATRATGDGEYPVLQIGVRVWRTRSGRVRSEIIREGYTDRTRFW